MKVSAQTLLIAAVVLLAANLVVMLGVYGAAPAHAQGRTCVGVAAACTADGSNWVVYKAWSDGTVEARSNIANTGSLGLTPF